MRIVGEGGEDGTLSFGCSVKVTLPVNLGGASAGEPSSVCNGMVSHVGVVDSCRGVLDGFRGSDIALLRGGLRDAVDAEEERVYRVRLEVNGYNHKGGDVDEVEGGGERLRTSFRLPVKAESSATRERLWLPSWPSPVRVSSVAYGLWRGVYPRLGELVDKVLESKFSRFGGHVVGDGIRESLV
jgi:hypothetical protein